MPGQRWVSKTEPELGLGIVYESSNRQVVITFPAGEERRTYAIDNAPITRVKYRIADKVRSEDGVEIIVADVKEIDNCLVYVGLSGDGKKNQVHEIDLDSFVHFNRPLDRLIMGSADGSSDFGLRAASLAHYHRQLRSPVYGLIGPRVQSLPHQFYIAEKIGSRFAPRVMLADEVGLGKTIEAGLILHRMLLTGRAKRVLLVVPENLIHQWLVEMLRRFNLAFSIIDDEIAQQLEMSGETNPFESTQLCLISLNFITESNARREQAIRAGWDVLLVDEAHHLHSDPESTSPEYRAVSELASSTPSLLLLTATPEQLGVYAHFARLALLDPLRYQEFDQFLKEEARYKEISDLVEQLITGDQKTQAKTMTQIETIIGKERFEAITSNSTYNESELIQELIDRHGTGRVLLRNRRKAIKGFPERSLTSFGFSYSPEFGKNTITKNSFPITENTSNVSWLEQDPRVMWLLQWLKNNRDSKALLITAQVETARDLEAHLRLRNGIRSAVFHENMDLLQRDRAAAYFADPEENAQVLVCSEIGSEGRNFQFAHHLILFDIPANPDLLEQRIGRLDRIGQIKKINIYALFFKCSGSEILTRWLNEGLNAFEETCPAGPALYQEFEHRLVECMSDPTNKESLKDLLSDTKARAGELQKILSQGKNRLLDLSSFNQNEGAAIIHEIKQSSRVPELVDFLGQVFNAFGVEHEENDPTSLIVQPGDHMRCESFPGLPEGGITITFDREQAQVREDMHFITWEHPMVIGAMSLILDSDFGNAALNSIKSSSFTPGSTIVECLFVIVCPAPRHLGVERYLSLSTLRHVGDNHGRDLTDLLSSELIARHINDIPPVTAKKILPRIRETVDQITEQAKHASEISKETVVQEAILGMKKELETEQDRIRDLAKKNPNIRLDEIESLESKIASSEHFLKNSQLKLDAIRVIIAT